MVRCLSGRNFQIVHNGTSSPASIVFPASLIANFNGKSCTPISVKAYQLIVKKAKKSRLKESQMENKPPSMSKASWEGARARDQIVPLFVTMVAIDERMMHRKN